MQKSIAAVMAAFLISGISLLASAVFYPAQTEVIKVDPANDLVFVETTDGNIWAFYGADGWVSGERCAVLFHDNGTPEIWDDAVVMARHVG